MSANTQQLPIQPVPKPIICPPYVEPNDHWVYDKEGTPYRAGKRRPASYWYKTVRTGLAQREIFAEEERDDLPLVNLLRDDVRRWRESGYRGATNVTKELLRFWASPKRARRLFFCQREAVETIIYLAELRMPGKSARTGFQKFELTDDNLSRLMRGEKMALDLTDPRFFPTLIDRPADASLLPLRRLGCKMATGSGKTGVMAMLIAWAFCNRGANPASTEFPNAVLVCCPNLTVKERLQVLRPDAKPNDYEYFDLVPVNLRPFLQAGRVLVTNWHGFAPESEHKEGDKSYAVVDKGPETPETLARRVLGDLYDRLPIMVFNDEGHHCWRPAPAVQEETIAEPPRRRGRTPRVDAAQEEKLAVDEEPDEARVWLQGLDWINSCRGDGRPGISMCVDLSATPFYIQGSGYPEGQPFPWLVSDFGLVDAIESGIVKIPRLPVMDDQNKKDEYGRPDPKYFRLWHHAIANLSRSQKYSSGKPKPEPLYLETVTALQQLAGQWLERFRQFQEATPNQEVVPPVLIVVCDNTEIADFFYRKISGESEADDLAPEDLADEADDENGETNSRQRKGRNRVAYGPSAILNVFANTPERQHTIRIDSKKLAEAESADPNSSRQTAAEELRRIVSTVGKRGQPGEFVRCVVSVSMLTEGWDANNVTQILGVRAFGSQLLCEQVVGRGLRRLSYTPDEETGLLKEEYVDVYGIPFTVIPFKGRPIGKPEEGDRPFNRVWAIPEREEEMEIRFPIVNDYVLGLTNGILRCNVEEIDPIEIDPRVEPITTFIRPTMGYVDSHLLANRYEFVEQDRSVYYRTIHFQTLLFTITQAIIEDFLNPTRSDTSTKAKVMRLQSRHQLFPQVFSYVQAFVARTNFNGHNPLEVGSEKYVKMIVERLRANIYPDDSAGEPPLLPILDRYRPCGSTKDVSFSTVRPVIPTVKSHLNGVAIHSTWEADAAKVLDSDELSGTVKCFARNDHLGLTIQYTYLGADHDYEPDFLVRLMNDLYLLLEIKGWDGRDPERTMAKNAGARKWVTAVNNLGEFERWGYLICGDVEGLADAMRAAARGEMRSEDVVAAPAAAG